MQVTDVLFKSAKEDNLTWDSVFAFIKPVYENSTIIYDKVQNLTLNFNDVNYGDFNGANYGVTETVQKMLLRKYKIPFNFFVSATPDLKEKVYMEGMSKFIAGKSSERDNAFHIKTFETEDGEDKAYIYGLLPKAYKPISFSAIFGNVRAALEDEFDIVEVSASINKVELILNSKTALLEEYKIGFRVLFSEIGEPFTMIPFLFLTKGDAIIEFTNSKGVILPFRKSMARYKQSEIVDEIKLFELTVKQKLNILLPVIEKFKEASIEDESVYMAIESVFIPSAKIRDDYSPFIDSKFNELGGENLWNLLQAMAQSLTLYSKRAIVSTESKGTIGLALLSIAFESSKDFKMKFEAKDIVEHLVENFEE